jgi:hypothetical protein
MKIYSFSDAPIAHSYFTHITSQCLRGDILQGEWWNPQPAAGHIFFFSSLRERGAICPTTLRTSATTTASTDTPHGAVGHDTPPSAHVM